MSKIEFYFGELLNTEIQENLEHQPMDNDVLIGNFDALISYLQTSSDKLNYFDLSFTELFKERVVSPNFSTSSHIHGSPALVFENDEVVENVFLTSLPISDEVLDKMGNLFAKDFHYEFLGYKKLS